MFGETLHPLTATELLEQLAAGNRKCLLTLNWGPGMPDHQLLLRGLDPEGRVYFHNPYRPEDHPIGTLLANPERRVEPDHLESVTLDQFEQFFLERNARAYERRS